MHAAIKPQIPQSYNIEKSLNSYQGKHLKSWEGKNEIKTTIREGSGKSDHEEGGLLKTARAELKPSQRGL